MLTPQRLVPIDSMRIAPKEPDGMIPQHEMDPCPFCRRLWWNEIWLKETCRCKHQSGGLICTRKRGHNGKHVACAGYRYHRVAEWYDDSMNEPRQER